MREVYLRVIDATVETLKADLQEKGAAESVIDSITNLQSRWSDRFVHTHDFTDDPLISDKPPSTKGAKRTSKYAAKKKAATKDPPPRNGSMSVASLTNKDSTLGPYDNKPSLPPIPRVPKGKAEPKVEPKVEPKDALPDNADKEPPRKRQRVAGTRDADEEVCTKEDLDSSDSDDESVTNDEEQAENLVLAKHDRVRKGPKWKVALREGIIAMRGREYLFNSATCELDF